MRGKVEGMQRLQAALNRAAAAVRPKGALGKAVKHVTAMVHRYAVAITPVDTGSWRASQRQILAPDARWGRVSIMPGAKNARTGAVVGRYAAAWEDRKGRYAVYLRTYEEEGQEALDAGGAIIRRALP